MYNENAVKFPVRRMKIGLKKSKYSILTPDTLKKQMNGIGLRCEETQIQNLLKHKNAVLDAMSFTENQAYSIRGPKNKFSEIAYLNSNGGELDENYILEANTLLKTADGEWDVDDTGLGYQEELSMIQTPVNFDYLMTTEGFTGQTKTKKEDKECKTVDAIKELYIQTGMTASQLFSENINKYSLEAFFSNAISALEEPKTNYECSDSRVMLLALEYDPVAKDAKGVAVINISWDIFIENYQRKDKDGGDYHKTKISIKCRGVFYSSLKTLEKDYLAVKNRVKSSICLMKPPVKPVQVPVFAACPEANRETFLMGLPSTVCDTYADSIILHSPELNQAESQTDGKEQRVTLRKGFDSGIGELNLAGVAYQVKVEASNDEVTHQTEFLITDKAVSRNNVIINLSAGNNIRAYSLDIPVAVLRYHAESGKFEYVNVKAGYLYGTGLKINS